jgi:uncharacterized RDD family membrane protein YckC
MIKDKHCESKDNKNYLAGFFRRGIAFVLDNLLLSGFIYILCFSSALNAILEVHNDVIFFFLALFYVGLLNSRAGNGQTLGKRIVGIRVLDTNGDLLSIKKSFLRYGILYIFILGNIFKNIPIVIISEALQVVVGMVTVASIYLLFFNRSTTRLLHDLCVGSLVVNVKSSKKGFLLQKVWFFHYIFLMIIIVTSFCIVIYQKQNDRSKELTEAINAVENLSFVANADIKEKNVFTNYNGAKRSLRYIKAEVDCKQDFTLKEGEEIKDSIFKIILDNTEGFQAKEIQLSLSFSRKYGIFKSSHSSLFNTNCNKPSSDL